jgi:hypothetical protein
MEFAAGVLLGIVGSYISFLALKAQLKQTDKRIHYVRFVSPFLVPRDDATREAVELYLNGRQLINPHLYVVRIENSGRAPITPNDFDSPIIVRLNKSIFTWATLSWNRSDILREEHKIKMSLRELRVGPILLNPRDALTLVALVEAAEDDLSVIARAAGVEQIVQIPPADWASALKFVNEEYLRKGEAGRESRRVPHTRLPSNALECWRFRWPLLANPDGQTQDLVDDVEIRVNGVTTSQPTMLTFGITNKTGRTLSSSDFGGLITVRCPQSVFRHGSVVDQHRVGRRLQERRQLPISVTDHEIRISPPTLDPDDTIDLSVILDGSGDDLEISSPSVPIVTTLSLVPDEKSPMTVSLEKTRRKLPHRILGLPTRQ